MWYQNLFCGYCHEQKEFHAEVEQDLLGTAYKDPDFLKKVINGDESWVYGYDPETNAHSSHWESPEFPHPKKLWQSWSNVVAMLTAYIYIYIS
jgi:hypothetical protein